MTDDKLPIAGDTSGQEPPQTAEMLRHILAAVEKDNRQRWMEVATAVVLSLATMASAWCAYQATRWSGVQTFRLSDAALAGRKSSQAAVTAIQGRAFDASMFIDYIEAKHTGNSSHEKFLYDRFRPEMKKAVDAWLKTDPFNNPAAPPTPFKMTEYTQAEMEEASRQDELGASLRAAAQTANATADQYVLITVLFASVLFFGGVGNTFRSLWSRQASLTMAIVLLGVAVLVLCTMPICKQ
jgi:hypothetical protein